MPIREHITSQSYIDWLKSLGCVFYAPLTEFETRDLISGSQMQQGNNGTVTWDANEQAWYFQDLYANVYDVVASWQNLSLPFDITNIGFTLLYELNIYQDGIDSSYFGAVIPLVLGGRTIALNARYVTSQLHTWYKVAQVFPKYEGVSRYSYAYSNGNVVQSVNRGTTRYTGNSLTNARVDSNYRNSQAYRNGKYYMRNAMVFDAALTQAQIKEIQQIP
jgi:hypothetical protein